MSSLSCAETGFAARTVTLRGDLRATVSGAPRPRAAGVLRDDRARAGSTIAVRAAIFTLLYGGGGVRKVLRKRC